MQRIRIQTRPKEPRRPALLDLRTPSGPCGHVAVARTPGFLAKALVRQGKGGDFRNPERIQTWAHHIGAELAA